MFSFLKEWLQRKVDMQGFYAECSLLGISDLEACLIQDIAENYPHSAKEILKVYLHCDRSIDKTIKVVEDAQRYSMDICEAFSLNISY